MNEINLQQLAQSAHFAAGAARQAQASAQAAQQMVQGQAEAFKTIQEALSRLQVRTSGGDPGIQRVENIPGARIPFDLLVDIPLAAGATTVRQGQIPVPADGPFVAVARSFSLMSTAEAVYTNPSTSTVSRFQGRSYGRYRPVHSVWDLNDGQPVFQTMLAAGPAFPGNGAPHMPSPSSQSSFRSMEGDFRIHMRVAGSGLPRQNVSVPSTMWVKGLSEPWELGALDVFERSEIVEINIQPLHVANPQAGNVAGFAAANPVFPFLASQYDCVEGIVDEADADADETDPVVRQYAWVATIGFHGYLIKNQPGLAAGM